MVLPKLSRTLIVAGTLLLIVVYMLGVRPGTVYTVSTKPKHFDLSQLGGEKSTSVKTGKIITGSNLTTRLAADYQNTRSDSGNLSTTLISEGTSSSIETWSNVGGMAKETASKEFSAGSTDTAQPASLKVIILAYMHTGSTYLASILQNHPGTFYEFEPLRSMQFQYNQRRTVSFLNNTVRRYTDSDQFTHAAADTVWNLLTCQHEKLDVHTITTHYFNLTSYLNRDVRQYYKCLQIRAMSYSPLLYNKTTQHIQLLRTQRLPETLHVPKNDILRCLPFLKKKCVEASMVVNKYIRMSMNMVEDILQRESGQEVKVIHLFRDPRAMMDSQVRKNDVNVQHFPTFVNRTQYMCQKMLSDFEVAEQLKLSYPDKIFTIRYETLVDKSTETVRKLFSFLGIPFLENDDSFVRMTSIRNRRFPTWRRHISQGRLEVINTYCHQLYEKFGYIPLDNIKDVQNVYLPDHLDTYN